MDVKFLEAQANALAKHIQEEAPPSISCIVTMVDMETGNIVTRATRMPRELYYEVLKALINKPTPEALA